MNNKPTIEDVLTQQVARDTKKLNRRSSWIIKIMESQWPAYLLPLTRIIEALGVQSREELDVHAQSLSQLLAIALNEYREGAEKISERSGLMPYEIPDATRYAMYLSGLVDELTKRFDCWEQNSGIRISPRKEKSSKTQEFYAERGRAYRLICSDSLQKYMRETGNEQAIIGDSATTSA